MASKSPLLALACNCYDALRTSEVTEGAHFLLVASLAEALRRMDPKDRDAYYAHVRHCLQQ